MWDMSAITESARGEDCTLNFNGVCCHNPDTTVWAHGNRLQGGKARGKKLAAYDHIGCYACYFCHMVLDGQHAPPPGLTRRDIEAREEIAQAISGDKLRAKGLWPTEEALEAKRIERYKRKNKSSKLVAANRSFLSRQLGY